MAFLAHLSMKPETNALKVSIIKTAAPIKEKVHFCYYRLAASVIERHLYLAFALVPEPCRRYPFPVEEEFAFFSEADDIILLHAVQLEEHLVVIISPALS